MASQPIYLFEGRQADRTRAPRRLSRSALFRALSVATKRRIDREIIARAGRLPERAPFCFPVPVIFTLREPFCFKDICISILTLVGVVLIIRAYTRVHVSSYRVSVSPVVVIRNELTQALTWHCLYSVRHVDHRRRRSRTSAVPARRIVLRRRPRHLGKDTGGGARRQEQQQPASVPTLNKGASSCPFSLATSIGLQPCF
jgi:hypothetical protein